MGLRAEFVLVGQLIALKVDRQADRPTENQADTRMFTVGVGRQKDRQTNG